MTVITASKSITSNVVQRSRRTILSVVNLKSVINARCRLTKKAEPPPARDVNRDSGTESANGGWLRRLVRPHNRHNSIIIRKQSPPNHPTLPHLPAADKPARAVRQSKCPSTHSPKIELTQSSAANLTVKNLKARLWPNVES